MGKREISLPLSNIGRKYGYITWKKRNDEQVKSVLGDADSVDLKIGKNIQQNKRIDWKKRRIGITYSLTRGLPEDITSIRMESSSRKSSAIAVVFE
jgi:hypothetical protein